jgi:serine/threonine-protein kinase
MKPRDLVDGRFEIERLAGSGGMGKVYRALDRRTGQPVALKALHGQSPDHLERFAREASLLAEIRHPGIVGFVSRGTTPEGVVFLVMDWLDGESLSQRLDRGLPAVAEVVALGQRSAEALAAAHARGVVHRDLKPGNVFLPGGDVTRPMLVDFGIARVNVPGQTLTRTGTTLGTPGYMSPEQAKGEPSVDGRADLFSLGCVLYRCLAGEPPFTGDAFSAMIKAVKEPAPPLSSFRGDLPPALPELIERLLAKSPDQRPRDAAAVAAELGAIAAGGAAPPTWQPPGGPAGVNASAFATASAPASLAWQPGAAAFSRPSVAPASAPARAAAFSRPSVAPASAPAAPSAPPTSRGWLIPVILLAVAAGMGLTLGVLALVGALPLGSGRARPPFGAGAALACYYLRCADVTYDDPVHVDLLELLPRATQMAQSIERGVTLCGITIVNAVDGTVAVTTTPTATPGTGSLRFIVGKGPRAIDVSPTPGRLIANESACLHAVPVPACTPRAASRAALASGSFRGPALLNYDHDATANTAVWTYTVAGHGDATRRLDGRTCAVLFKPPR